MSWWGKLLGGTFGFMLSGPLGALIGAAIGHTFDRGLNRMGSDDRLGFDDLHASARERTQTAFFTATFSVMGHVAKADGQVSEAEVRTASAIMDELGLSADQRRVAQGLFREGKSPDFPLDEVLEQFRRECRRSRNLVRMFLEIQVHAAYADGTVHPAERRILERVCERLHIPARELAHLEAMIQAEMRGRGGARGPAPARGPSLDDAYTLLDVPRSASDAEVKRAYRRLMSQHHPDKLVARGLPEEMMRLATEKTQEIRSAYERIRESRKA